MKKAPLILISASAEQHGAEFGDTSLSLSHRYTQAIQAAGGLPWILPMLLAPAEINECVSRCDGVMLTGGDDVQPDLYLANLTPELKRELSPVNPWRDLFELRLIEAIFQQRKPLLALCRGQQILNVALGGSLYVDIVIQAPNALNHRQLDKKSDIVHDIILEPDSLLAKTFGKTVLGVNSTHHQAVERVARPFRTVATSPDGIIEALEIEPSMAGLLPYLVAVQFHPERLFDKHPEFLELFRGFVKACAKPRRKSL